MSGYSIEVITTDLPGNNGHAGVQVVAPDGSVIASVHGGPESGGSPDWVPSGGFLSSTIRDSVPLVVNVGGGIITPGDQGYIPEHSRTIATDLTREQAIDLLSSASEFAHSHFGTNTEYQAAYVPTDLPINDRLTAIANGLPVSVAYQNSNSVAYLVGQSVIAYARLNEYGQVIGHCQVDFT